MIKVSKNLQGGFGSARDQGLRSTCLLFTVSDLNRHANAIGEALSVDYLAHHVEQLGHSWRGGIHLSAANEALTKAGQPDELKYPYDGNDEDRPLSKPGKITPPFYSATLESKSPRFSWVLDTINIGAPVGLLLQVKNCLFLPVNGVVEDKPDKFLGRHAVVGVGAGEHKDSGESHVLIRNSWGAHWGSNGYAWVPESYFSTGLFGAFLLENGTVLGQ